MPGEKEVFSIFGVIGLDNDPVLRGLRDVDDAARSTAEKVGKQYTEIGSGLTASVTAPILAFGAAAFNASSQVNVALASIRQDTGATGEELLALEQDFRAVAASSEFSFDQVGETIGQLNARTGATGESLRALTTDVLNLADVTGEDLNALVASSTRLLGDWSIPIEDSGEALGNLLIVSQNTGIGVNTLAERLVQFGGPLRQLGFDIDESAALLGKFEQEGVNTELVLGSLRIALGRMSKDGVTDVKAGLDSIIEGIKNAGTAGEANALAIESFGARAGPDMAAAIREGRFELDGLMAQLAASPETLQAAADESDTLSDSFSQLKNQTLLAIEPVGVKLLEAVKGLLPGIASLIEHVANVITWLTNLPTPIQNAIGILGGLAAAVGPVLVVIGQLIPLITAGGPLAAGMAALTGPIGLVIAAIAALATAFSTNFLGIRDAVNAGFENVKPLLESLGSAFGEMFSAIGELLAQFNISFPQLEQVARNVISALGPIISGTIEIIVIVLKTIIDNVTEFVKLINNLIEGDFSGAWDNAKNILSNFATGIIEIFATLVTSMIDAGANVVSGFVEGLTGQLANAKETVQSFANNISGWFTDTLDIQSPSKIFYGHGEDIVMGLVNAIVDDTKLATDASENLARSMSEVFSAWIKGIQAEASLGFVPLEDVRTELEKVKATLLEQLKVASEAGTSGTETFLAMYQQLLSVDAALQNINTRIDAQFVEIPVPEVKVDIADKIKIPSPEIIVEVANQVNIVPEIIVDIADEIKIPSPKIIVDLADEIKIPSPKIIVDLADEIKIPSPTVDVDILESYKTLLETAKGKTVEFTEVQRGLALASKEDMKEALLEQEQALKTLLGSLVKGSDDYLYFGKLLVDTRNKYNDLTDTISIPLPVPKVEIVQSEFSKFTGLLDNIANQFTGLPNTILKGASSIIKGFENIFKSGASIKDILGGITQAFQGLASMMTRQTSVANQVVEGFFSIGGQVAELITGIPGLGAVISAAGQVFSSVLGDMGNGLQEVRGYTAEVQEGFDLIDVSNLIKTNRVSRGGLLGLLGFTKAQVDKEATEYALSIARKLEDGFVGGIKNGAKQFLSTGDAVGLLGDLREGLRGTVEDAIIEGVINAAFIKGKLGPQLEELTQAIASGADPSDIIKRIGNAIPGLAADIATTLEPLRGVLDEAFPKTKEIEDAAKNVTLPETITYTPNVEGLQDDLNIDLTIPALDDFATNVTDLVGVTDNFTNSVGILDSTVKSLTDLASKQNLQSITSPEIRANNLANSISPISSLLPSLSGSSSLTPTALGSLQTTGTTLETLSQRLDQLESGITITIQVDEINTEADLDKFSRDLAVRVREARQGTRR